jgi:hypothetical protein
LAVLAPARPLVDRATRIVTVAQRPASARSVRPRSPPAAGSPVQRARPAAARTVAAVRARPTSAMGPGCVVPPTVGDGSVARMAVATAAPVAVVGTGRPVIPKPGSVREDKPAHRRIVPMAVAMTTAIVNLAPPCRPAARAGRSAPSVCTARPAMAPMGSARASRPAIRRAVRKAAATPLRGPASRATMRRFAARAARPVSPASRRNAAPKPGSVRMSTAAIRRTATVAAILRHSSPAPSAGSAPARRRAGRTGRAARSVGGRRRSARAASVSARRIARTRPVATMAAVARAAPVRRTSSVLNRTTPRTGFARINAPRATVRTAAAMPREPVSRGTLMRCAARSGRAAKPVRGPARGALTAPAPIGVTVVAHQTVLG